MALSLDALEFLILFLRNDDGIESMSLPRWVQSSLFPESRTINGLQILFLAPTRPVYLYAGPRGHSTFT